MNDSQSWFIPAGVKRLARSCLPGVPNKAPACFGSQRSWQIYRYLADWLGKQRKLSTRFTFCSDCTPAYRDAMHACGRCRYPKTTFRRIRGIIIGTRNVK